MVIHESLRLYSPVPLVPREAFEDLKFGDILVPKGFNLWTLLVALHQDPDIWGPNAKEFNPERFANGVNGSCKLPHVYMPFGVGPRTCLGQNFAMAELKIILSLIVSNFSLSLSPKYRHSPTMRLVIVPEYGVNLLIKSL
jgi:cytochrome P450